MTYQATQSAIAVVLEFGALIYAAYAGFLCWRPRYTLLTTLLLALLAGAALLLWEPEPPGAPILIPIATLGISLLARMCGQPNRTGRWTGRITLAALLAAAALFATACAIGIFAKP